MQMQWRTLQINAQLDAFQAGSAVSPADTSILQVSASKNIALFSFHNRLLSFYFHAGNSLDPMCLGSNERCMGSHQDFTKRFVRHQ
jgi:hypothetical protein